MEDVGAGPMERSWVFLGRLLETRVDRAHYSHIKISSDEGETIAVLMPKAERAEPGYREGDRETERWKMERLAGHLLLRYWR